MSLKYPPVTAIASASIRSKDWEDVVTAHMDDGFARTWRVQEKKVGRWSLKAGEGAVKVRSMTWEPGNDAVTYRLCTTQAVSVSACGNYGLVGSSTGHIRMYNMQSGQQRKTFSLDGVAPDKKKKLGKGAARAVNPGHSITGLASDSLNRILVASTLDGVLHVRTPWNGN